MSYDSSNMEIQKGYKTLFADPVTICHNVMKTTLSTSQN